jgi:hypothetical protein
MSVRVLVVEDDPTIGGGLRDTLTAQGYSVGRARSPVARPTVPSSPFLTALPPAQLRTPFRPRTLAPQPVFVRPMLGAQVQFLARAGDGRLRHASYKGLHDLWWCPRPRPAVAAACPLRGGLDDQRS